MGGNDSGPATRPSLLLRIRDPQDTEAWQTFVDIYGPLVYRHCRNKGLQDADASEVMQEVLLQVNRSIARFEYRPERGRFRDWLGTVTRNELYSFIAKKARAIQSSGHTEQGDALEGVASPEQETQWSESFNRHILQMALARIIPHFEERTWRAFALVWIEHRSPLEVARELGQELDWVYVAKSRVLKRLQQEVQELAEDTVLHVR